MKGIVNDLNIKKQAEELGVSFWQAPSFLFLLLGLSTIVIMTTVYFISIHYNSPELIILSETITVIITLTIGNIIIRNFESVAKMNKMKSEFVSIASHQLKTPLSQIKWEMELLTSKHNKGLSEKQKDILDCISKSNSAMIRLSNDLLDVARIDQGRFILNKEDINIVEIVENVIKANEILAKASNVEVKLIKPDFVPMISADKRRLGVAIDNLVTNAIRYVRSKGFVEIEIRNNDNKTVSMCVKDNGVGIPEEQQTKIFHKFFRSDNAVKYQTEGTGLGLYISKNIIEQSGGKMWFKSIENVGSIFCFSIPAKKEK